MADPVYSGLTHDPYPELIQAGQPLDAGMVVDLGGSHRLGYPDLWISAQGKPLPQNAQKALLEVLAEVRSVRPREHFFLYCDAYGHPTKNLWYLMKSKDGVRFTALTHADGWEDFVCEMEILMEHHDQAPADDPNTKMVAEIMGFTPLDE